MHYPVCGSKRRPQIRAVAQANELQRERERERERGGERELLLSIARSPVSREFETRKSRDSCSETRTRRLRGLRGEEKRINIRQQTHVHHITTIAYTRKSARARLEDLEVWQSIEPRRFQKCCCYCGCCADLAVYFGEQTGPRRRRRRAFNSRVYRNLD